jgi:hypothetical protein
VEPDPDPCLKAAYEEEIEKDHDDQGGEEDKRESPRVAFELPHDSPENEEDVHLSPPSRGTKRI